MSWVDEHEPNEEEQLAALDDLYGEMRGVRLNTRRRQRRKKLDHKRKGATGRRSPVTDYVKSLGDYYTTAEVAEMVGRSENWVRKAAAKRWTQAPSYVAPFGDAHVNLYTDEDVKALRDYIAKNRRVYERDEYPREEG